MSAGWVAKDGQNRIWKLRWNCRRWTSSTGWWGTNPTLIPFEMQLRRSLINHVDRLDQLYKFHELGGDHKPFFFKASRS